MRATERLVGVEDNTERAERGGYMKEHLSQLAQQLLEQRGAIIRFDSSISIELARILRHTSDAALLARYMLGHWQELGIHTTALTLLGGPDGDGVLLAQAMAFVSPHEVSVSWVEIEQDGHVLRHGNEETCVGDVLIIAGLVDDDSDLYKTVSAIKAVGGNPVGVLAVVDRRRNREDLDLPVHSLLYITRTPRKLPPDVAGALPRP